MTFSSIRKSGCSRLISLCVIASFVVTMVITPKSSYAYEGVLGLPQPGTMVNLSSTYVPLMVTGLTIHPENPLLMDFIVSTGNSGLNAHQVKIESDRLIKYFLACLTIPEDDQWVNLSPYEKQRIVPEDLGQTVLGQDMLAQDYLLKQLTASLIYPEKNLGKNFWDKVYAKANEMYGTTQIPVNTFNKVWILPDTAKVYEHKNTVFVVKSHLKVMLDEDYLALSKHADIYSSSVNANSSGVNMSNSKTGDLGKGLANASFSEAKQSQVNNLGSQIVRQVILPAIEQEVNTGKNFAQLRQIYNSMILAVWFKKNLKEALLNQVYTDKSKVNGVNVDDPAIKEKIYKQYLQAYKKGVFNYIKEDIEKSSQQVIPRKYFSGGLTPERPENLQSVTLAEAEPIIEQEEENGSEVYDILGRTQGAGAVVGEIQSGTDKRGVRMEEVIGAQVDLAGNEGEWQPPEGYHEDEAMMGQTSPFHEDLWRSIDEFSKTHGGSTPQSTHNVLRKVRVSDIVEEGGDIKNMPQAEREINMVVAGQKIEELSREGKKIAVGAMVAGMASRNQKGQLPDLYITAMKEDPEQFVDQTKLTDEERAKVAEIGLQAFINSFNPYDSNTEKARADHDVLNRLLHESKALLPVNKEAINDQHIEPKYRSKTGWYNFLAYTAINVGRANDALEKKGLNRIFIYKIMASELNYQKIMDNLVQNNFFGLNVPGVKRDETGKIIDIDHTDLRNEVVIYTQGMGYRLVAPVETVKAQWENDQRLLDQADRLTNEAEKRALYAKTQFATEGDREKALANYNEALAFSEESEREGRHVLYDSPVAEGHGERWHMQFQTNRFGPQIPNFLLDFQRGIQYDFFHNIDNMANLDDNWMVEFGWMLRNKKKLVMEASMKPGNESAGGGFSWTLVNGRPVMRQVEGPELNASIANRTISPEYNAAEEKRKDDEDKVGDVNDEMPLNNATVFAELPTTVESIRTGADVYSANMSSQARERLADIVENGNFQNVDLKEFKRFGDELRSRFGALTTPKSVRVDGKTRLTLVNETLAWDIQKGLLDKDQVGIVFTGSLADVRERGFNAEQARFIPLKQRPDAADPVINGARDKVARRIIFGNFFETFLPLVGRGNLLLPNTPYLTDEAMITMPAESQNVDQKSGTNGWRASVDANGDVTKGKFNLYTVARMAYAWAQNQNPQEVTAVVGFDNRPNGNIFALVFARILRSQGFDVEWSPRATTSPALIRMTNPVPGQKRKVAFLITGSHNSPEDNGIKFFEGGVVMPDYVTIPVTAAVKEITSFPEVPLSATFDMKEGEFPEADSLSVSQEHYESNFPGLAAAIGAYRASTHVETIVDQMHGSSSGLADYLRSLGLEVIQDRTVPMSQVWQQAEFRDRRYNEPGKTQPVPFRPEPKEVFLHERFQQFKANAQAGSLYFAIDGDADRLAVWVKLADGNIMEVAPNDLGVLYGWMLVNDVLKEEYPATGEPKVFYVDKTQPTTTGMDFLVEYGNHLAQQMGKNVRFELRVTPVGSKNFAPEYQNGTLLIGVEESGHIVIKDFFDDAVGQLHFLLKALSASGRSLNDTIHEAKKAVGDSVHVDLNSWVYQRVNPQITPQFTNDFLEPIKAGNPEIALQHLVAALGGRGKEIRAVRMTTVSPTFETGNVQLLGEYEALRAQGRAPELKPAEGMILSFNDGSWLMVRVSGTEGLVRVYAEAPSKADVIAMQRAVVQAFGVEIKFDAAMNGVNYDDEDNPTVSTTANVELAANGTVKIGKEEFPKGNVLMAINLILHDIKPDNLNIIAPYGIQVAKTEYSNSAPEIAEALLQVFGVHSERRAGYVVASYEKRDNNQINLRQMAQELNIWLGAQKSIIGFADKALVNEDQERISRRNPSANEHNERKQPDLDGAMSAKYLPVLHHSLGETMEELRDALLGRPDLGAYREIEVHYNKSTTVIGDLHSGDLINSVINWLREQFGEIQNVDEKKISDEVELINNRLLIEVKDAATIAEPGGIDLNSRTLKMQSEGEKVNITFDPAMVAQFKRGDFSGVKIQILDVVPINLMPLLGMKEDELPGTIG